jgi:2'-5' RNA ligase
VGTSKPNKPGSRLFVALDPPGPVALEVAEWARRVAGTDRRMRPVPQRFCHITMAFIGESSESSIAPISEAVEDSASAVTGLSLAAPVWLPRRRPRALALDIRDQTSELAACQSRLATALEAAIGWQSQHHFRPHLTALRLGRGIDPEDCPLPVSPAAEFSGEALTLYRSRLLAEGAQYEALFTVGL